MYLEETRCRHIGYSFFDKQQGVFYMHRPSDGTAHTTAFEEPAMHHWMERKIAQQQMGYLRRIDATTDSFTGGYATV